MERGEGGGGKERGERGEEESGRVEGKGEERGWRRDGEEEGGWGLEGKRGRMRVKTQGKGKGKRDRRGEGEEEEEPHFLLFRWIVACGDSLGWRLWLARKPWILKETGSGVGALSRMD